MKLQALRDLRWFQQAAALLLCSALGIGLAFHPAQAQSAQSDYRGAIDPPGRVGRLSDISGQVWLYSPDAGEWVAADRNRPLTTGDRLSTDASARAEVRIGSTTLRLASNSELEVLRLDDEHISLQLHSGSTAVRLRDRDNAAQFELTTAEGRFRTQRAGRYRFDRSDDTSQATVWSGQAYYEGPGSALTIASGQRAEFWIDNRNAAQYSITDPTRDAFASWNSERDRSDDRRASERYVSPEMTGIEDLDRNGRWEQTPEYGALWTPRAVAPGWAPYAAGHWAWVRPWGWTWVDDAPWGFAPFHYGRWVWFRSAWCWAPGTYVARPVYAPALVGWVGGPQLSVSISIGGSGGAPSVGWFPLAPREVYVPTYRVSPGYVQNVNITHVTNITNITTIINNPQAAVGGIDYSNRKFPHAITVVPQTVLSTRQPVAPAAAQWRQAHGEDGREGGDRGRRALQAVPVAAAIALAAAPVAAPLNLRREERRGADNAVNAGAAKAPAVGALPNPARAGGVPGSPLPSAVPPPPSRMNRPAVRAAEEAIAPAATSAATAVPATAPAAATATARGPTERRGRDARDGRDGRDTREDVRPGTAAVAPNPVAVPPVPAAPVSPTRAAPNPVMAQPVPVPTRVQPSAVTAVAALPLPAPVAKPNPRSEASRDGNAAVVPPPPSAPPRAVRAERPAQAVEPRSGSRPVPPVLPQAAVGPAPRGETAAVPRRGADAPRPAPHDMARQPAREPANVEPHRPTAQERRGEPRERGQAN